MKKIKSKDFRESSMPMNFMNTLVKNLLHSIGFVEIGRSNKFFNPDSRQSIPNSGIVMFNGFDTSLSLRESGLFLQVDSMARIVQNRSVLDLINEIYSKNKHLSKEEKRGLVKENLIGRMVLANYGTSKHWII